MRRNAMTSGIAVTDVLGPSICETFDIAVVDVSQTSDVLLFLYFQREQNPLTSTDGIFWPRSPYLDFHILLEILFWLLSNSKGAI